MCGRYAVFLPAEAIAALFQTSGPTPGWDPTWNMAPTRDAPVVRLHPATGERRLDLLRWGLLPHWAKMTKFGRQPTNARAETIASAPTFRDAYAQRRCLVPANAFYEWQSTQTGKRAWVIARADDQPLVFAGLWEGWRGGDGVIIRTFTIVTTAANDALRHLHARMPAVLEPADWPVWLGETDGDPAGVLHPSTAAFRFWQVGSGVNHVRNDGPELMEPLRPGADRLPLIPDDRR